MSEVITQHLDVWTSAFASKASAGRGSSDKQTSYGVKKLREFILELAVRGKLVPQDPNDEPASILLSKISTELKIANPNRKTKKISEVTQNSDYEKPFALPTGWAWVSLEAIGNIFNGNSVNSSIKQSKYTNLDSGLPFIATKDVGYGWDKLDYGNGVLIPLNETGFRVAHKNAVLICAEGGSAGKKCGITQQDICFGNKLFAIELYGEIEPNYILANYLTPTFFQQFTEKMTGIIGGISSTSFSQLTIPLPPLAEQHRIVAKVDELMALCDQLEQQQTDHLAAHQTLVQTLLDTLTQAADAAEFEQAWSRIADQFDTLFTTESSIDQLKQTLLQLAVMGKLVPQDPHDEPASILLEKVTEEKNRLIKENRLKKDKPLPALTEDEMIFPAPNGWIWIKFGVIAEFINGDRSKNYPNRSEYVDTGVAWINTGHIEPNGRLTTHEMNFITREKFNSLNSGKIQKGDIVYCLRGATFGKTAFVEPYEEGAIASSLMIIRPFIVALNKYIFQYLISPFGRAQLFRFDNGSAQPNLSAGNVMLYAFPLPPLAEQHRIVAKVDELMALCDALKARIAAAQSTQLQLADAIVEQAVA